MPDALSPDVPLLYGGISKQPSHLRFPHQVADASNVRFSVKDGIHKRPGTSYVVKVTGLTAAGRYGLHPIIRDETERYLAVYGDSLLKIFEEDGTACTVTISADAQTYIDSGSADADDMRLITIADHTELVNRLQAIAVGNESNNYTVTATHRDYDVLSSYCPTASTYHQALADTAEVPAGYFQFANITGFGRWEYANPSNWRQPYARWNDSDKNPMGFKVRLQRQDLNITGASYTSATGVINKTGGFTNYTYGAGDEVEITNGGGGIPSGWYAVTSKTDNDNIVIGTGHGDGTVAVDGVSINYDVQGINFNTTGADDMYDVALRFQTALRGAGATDACINYTSTGASSGKFEIITEEYGTGAAVRGLSAPSTDFDLTLNSGRPFHFASGTTTAGSGTANQTLEVDGRWTPVAAPGSVSAEPTPITLPISITRTSLGPPVVFTVALQSWSARTSGSASTNPAPTPMTDGDKIVDMVFEHNRRWCFAGEWAFTSQAGDYNNFFIENQSAVADSDPILVRMSSDQVTIIDSAIVYRDSILIFTKAARQFEISAADYFSQDTVRTKPVSQYAALTIPPEKVEGRVYFVAADSTTGQLIELAYNDLDVQTRGIDTSLHVEGLLPTTFQRIRVHNGTQTVFLLGVDGTKIYVYQQYRIEGQEEARKQSAWTVYTFDSSYRICDIAIIDDEVYMLVESASQYFIEKFPVEGADDSCTCGASTTASTASTPGTSASTPPITPPGGHLTPPGTTGGSTSASSTYSGLTPPPDPGAGGNIVR